jgi:nitrate reductase gamma subunit
MRWAFLMVQNRFWRLRPGELPVYFCFIGLLPSIASAVYLMPRIRINSSFADIMLFSFFFLLNLTLGLCTIPVSMHHLDGHEMVKFMEWAQHIVTFRGDAHLNICE